MDSARSPNASKIITSMNIRIHILFPAVASALMGLCQTQTVSADPVVLETPGQGMMLGAPLADHAVLQRQMPVPVWGWSKPGTEVTVEFAGQKKSTAAAESGKWSLALDPLEASAEPREMTIVEKGGASRTLKDILVGEVWMASGQSNMQWIVSKSSVQNLIDILKADGENPPIREFEVTSVFAALHPIERAKGVWKVNDYGNCSAVALAFALKIQKETGVPVGILNCSFSQTSIESWIPREGFAAGTGDYTKSIQRKLLETDPSTPEHKAAWIAFYQSLEDTLKSNATLVAAGKAAQPVFTKTPGNMNDNRDASWMFNGRMSPVVPYAIRGAIWNQGYANIDGGILYYQNLHSLIRGWRLKWNNPALPVYFHQFYCPGSSNEGNTFPSIDPMAEMRLGARMARDIPHTGMASQIDIAGAIHYYQKALPGQRLALHALRNQYGKKNLVTDGPIFKSYSVSGDQLTIEFDHAEGCLVVAETATNSGSKPTATCDGLATPKIIPEGASRVNHFWLAGEDRVWHPATIRIENSKVIATSPAVKNPRGVSYGTGGIGFRPCLYNRSLLPATPFIEYDNKTVTSETWPDKPMKIAGVKVDPDSVGIVYDYRKMPLLSSQFRDNAILQADMPLTFFGSAVVWPGYPPDYEGSAEIRFDFAGTRKTIPVTKDMQEWSLTLPPLPASKEPRTLSVSFHIDGKVIHERVCKNILMGDVWYVASPSFDKKTPPFAVENSGQPVRIMTRKAKRANAPAPARFSVSTSYAPDNRFGSLWEDPTTDFASALGHRLAKKSGRPTGVIHMTSDEVPLSSWIPFKDLKNAPSLMADYENLAQVQPGNEIYDANVRRYISAWKSYWSDFIPQMIATRGVPNGETWGTYPQLAGGVTSKASETHNVCAISFIPGTFKGIVFLTGPAMVAGDQGKNFGPEMSALANSFIHDFGGQTKFTYTIPDQSLVPGITAPTKINGASAAVPIKSWERNPALIDLILESAQNPSLKD